MATINYVNQEYVETYITEILTRFKAWIDTGKNIAFKKVLLKGNSLYFYKNPESKDTDEPQYKIDLPIKSYIEPQKTDFVSSFLWSEDLYPESINPNLDGNPVLVLVINNVGYAGDGTDIISYRFIDMSGIIKISSDSNNSLSLGSDGGLFSPTVDISNIQTQISELESQVERLFELYNQLSGNNSMP